MHRLLFAAAAAALLSVPARAQDAPADSTAPPPPNGPRKGAWSLSFVAPGYTGGERAEVGVWEMVGSRTNLGVTLEVGVFGTDRDGDGEDQTQASTSLGLGFNVRRYLASGRAVVPYLQGRAFGRGSYSRRDGSSGGEDVFSTSTAGVEGVLGAEWFALRHVSFSGHTGARFSATRQRQQAEDAQGNEFHSTTRDVGFQTFTSALSLQIYF
jgi:hypothetical protein